jgi:hypothetical protein
MVCAFRQFGTLLQIFAIVAIAFSQIAGFPFGRAKLMVVTSVFVLEILIRRPPPSTPVLEAIDGSFLLLLLVPSGEKDL